MRVKHNHVKFNKNCSICTLLKEFNEDGKLTDEQYELYVDYIDALTIHRRKLLRSTNFSNKLAENVSSKMIKSGENDFQIGVALATMNLLLRNSTHD